MPGENQKDIQNKEIELRSKGELEVQTRQRADILSGIAQKNLT
jgi:hypothetical protein